MIVTFYSYPNRVISEVDRAPSECSSRVVWSFEVQAEHRGVAVRHGMTRWETRETSRHKWKRSRAWHAEPGDILDRRSLPDGYLVSEMPEIPDEILSRVMESVRGTVHFDGRVIARKRQ